MAQYDVYRMGRSGFVIDVQSDMTLDTGVRVVIPLAPSSEGRDFRAMSPMLDLAERPYRLVTQEIAAVPGARLGPVVTNAGHLRDEITRALDILFHGF